MNAERPTPGPERTRPRGILPKIVSVCAILGVASLIVPILLTSADIVWRRAIGGAFMDTVDITKLCLVIAASLAIPYGFIRGTHVSVDLLTERFPPGLQTALEVATLLATAVLLSFFAWLSWQSAVLHYIYGDTTPNLRIPVAVHYGIFLFGLGLAILACLRQAASVLRTGRVIHHEPMT